MIGNTSQGLYSPIPQSFSDSDSEKDIIAPRFTNSANHQIKHIKHDTVSGYKVPKSTPPTRITESKKLNKKMSPLRTFLFVFSISICFLTIAIFLWVLPCSEKSTCSIKVSNWESQHENLELIGKINVIGNMEDNVYNLAIAFQHSLTSIDTQNGVISVLGTNGGDSWIVRQNEKPTELNCDLVDVNLDIINDCLLLGPLGLEAIDAITGEIVWHAHSHPQGEIVLDLSMPIVIHDINKDGFNDLLTTSNSRVSKFLLISGQTGIVIGQTQPLTQCTKTVIMEFDVNNVTYACSHSAGITFYTITSNELVSHIFNNSSLVMATKTRYKQKDDGLIVNGRRIVVKNMGSCPGNCNTTIAFINTSTNETIESWNYNNSYVMRPASFVFNPTKSNMLSLNGHLTGYVVKIWHWYSYSNKNRQPIFPNHNISDNSTINVNTIMEQIVLITFNNTNVHVINASLVEITQLCFGYDEGRVVCQPNIASQNNSLLIGDLDKDNSQELVSYSITFTPNNLVGKNFWSLTSTLKVIHLEEELLKLYEAGK